MKPHRRVGGAAAVAAVAHRVPVHPQCGVDHVDVGDEQRDTGVHHRIVGQRQRLRATRIVARIASPSPSSTILMSISSSGSPGAGPAGPVACEPVGIVGQLTVAAVLGSGQWRGERDGRRRDDAVALPRHAPVGSSRSGRRRCAPRRSRPVRRRHRRAETAGACWSAPSARRTVRTGRGHRLRDELPAERAFAGRAVARRHEGVPGSLPQRPADRAARSSAVRRSCCDSAGFTQPATAPRPMSRAVRRAPRRCRRRARVTARPGSRAPSIDERQTGRQILPDAGLMQRREQRIGGDLRVGGRLGERAVALPQDRRGRTARR